MPNICGPVFAILWKSGFGFECGSQSFTPGDCIGTAPSCGASAADCTSIGQQWHYNTNDCGSNGCWTGTKVQCRRPNPCTACPSNFYLSGGDCLPCASCSGDNRIRRGCGGSSAGWCRDRRCVMMDYRSCPSSATQPCNFEKTVSTMQRSSTSDTDTVSWSVGSQLVAEPAAARAANAEVTVDAEVGGSTSQTRTTEYVNTETGTSTISISPGWVYCFGYEVQHFSDGAPRCTPPMVYEAEIQPGSLSDVCGGFVQLPQCTSGCTGHDDVAGSSTMSLCLWVRCSVMVALWMVLTS